MAFALGFLGGALAVAALLALLLRRFLNGPRDRESPMLSHLASFLAGSGLTGAVLAVILRKYLDGSKD